MFAAADLLDSWERGQSLPLPDRAEHLLAVLGLGPAARAELSVGQRDLLLMELRARVFGSQVVGMAACPQCGELFETSFGLEEVRVDPPGDPAAPLELDVDGWTVRARPPKAGDLLLREWPGVPGDPRLALLERCVLASRRGETEVPVRELPGTVLARLVEAFAEADPQADVRLAFDCSACGHGWGVGFDILAFFWAELDAWGRRLLREVHALARAYGWREADILSLSGWRRAQYLGLVAP